MHKASVMSVHTQANSHIACWLMNVFVNEIALPHGGSQKGLVCVAMLNNYERNHSFSSTQFQRYKGDPRIYAIFILAWATK